MKPLTKLPSLKTGFHLGTRYQGFETLGQLEGMAEGFLGQSQCHKPEL